MSIIGEGYLGRDTSFVIFAAMNATEVNTAGGYEEEAHWPAVRIDSPFHVIQLLRAGIEDGLGVLPSTTLPVRIEGGC